MTTPTGPAAGVHLPWAGVPAAVKAWAAGIGGGAPDAVRDVAGGFSPGATAVLECAGRDVFVKAVGAELNPDSPDMHRREVVVSAALPRSPRLPRLLGSYDDGDWVALAFEAVDGRPPRHPWETGELVLVTEALSSLHRDLTPSPLPSLTRAGRLRAPPLRGMGGAGRAGRPRRRGSTSGPARTWTGWPSWSRAGRRRARARRWCTATCAADNVLLAADGVVFVDWPHAAVGTPVFDVIGWAPSVVLEGGPPPEELLARHVAPMPIDPDVITVLLAAVAGFFVAHSLRPPPPGLPTIRPFQAAQGEVALAWLRRRTGW